MSATAGAISDAEFAGLIEPLGPWPGTRHVAVAVSGGADSLCLATLAARWAASRGIAVTGLIVDHGLRTASAREAAITAERLLAHGVGVRVLTLQGLDPGTALAERARTARYAALSQACQQAGIVDLLVGHHAGDQAETVLMRRRAGSGADGLAGMASVSETIDLRLLRPLLPLSPDRMRRTLQAIGLDWVEDPSNQDARALRTRLRRELAEPGGAAFAAELLRQAVREGGRRQSSDLELAQQLAVSSMLRPEGFAVLPPLLAPARALAALIRTVTGAPYSPMLESVASLVRNPRPLTLAGARLLPAGRLGPGWLLVREAAQVQAPVPAGRGIVWDGRFRVHAQGSELPPGSMVAALGPDIAFARFRTGLPAAVLSVMPSLRDRDGAVLSDGLSGNPFGFEPTLAATTRPGFLTAGDVL